LLDLKPKQSNADCSRSNHCLWAC